MTVGRNNRTIFFKVIYTKYLALLIGVFYLANPLQEQIGTVFHEVSHFFEVPDNVIGHEMPANPVETAHHYHEHIYIDDEHEHEIIDFLTSIFDASDEDEAEESLLTKIKFDKHISNDGYPEEKIYPTDKKVSFFSIEYGIPKTYSGVLKEPPKIFPARL